MEKIFYGHCVLVIIFMIWSFKKLLKEKGNEERKES
jgi:hypothetical protein